MGRFHKSMSWNQPTESGPPQSESNETDDPVDSSFVGWEAFYDSHHFDNSDDNDSGRDRFILADDAWARFKAHRSFFLPLHYLESYEYPLVVWLHSNGYNENQIDHVMPHISLRNYIGVGIRGTKAADSAGHRFDWHESPAAIATSHDAVIEAIDEASERFSIQKSRIVLAGYGAGGTMAMRVAMRDPNRVASAISIGGRMPQGAIRNVHQLRQRRLPMLWQWAEFNPDYSPQNLQTDCRSAMTIGCQVEVRQYQGDEEMDTVVLRDIDDWIMRRIVSGSSVTTSDRWATSPTAYSHN
jgi:phospholipase/carboxylesterase